MNKAIVRCHCGHQVLAKEVLRTDLYERRVSEGAGREYVYVKFRCRRCKRLGEAFVAESRWDWSILEPEQNEMSDAERDHFLDEAPISAEDVLDFHRRLQSLWQLSDLEPPRDAEQSSPAVEPLPRPRASSSPRPDPAAQTHGAPEAQDAAQTSDAAHDPPRAAPGEADNPDNREAAVPPAAQAPPAALPATGAASVSNPEAFGDAAARDAAARDAAARQTALGQTAPGQDAKGQSDASPAGAAAAPGVSGAGAAPGAMATPSRTNTNNRNAAEHTVADTSAPRSVSGTTPGTGGKSQHPPDEPYAKRL